MRIQHESGFYSSFRSREDCSPSSAPRDEGVPGKVDEDGVKSKVRQSRAPTRRQTLVTGGGQSRLLRSQKT